MRHTPPLVPDADEYERWLANRRKKPAPVSSDIPDSADFDAWKANKPKPVSVVQPPRDKPKLQTPRQARPDAEMISTRQGADLPRFRGGADVIRRAVSSVGEGLSQVGEAIRHPIESVKAIGHGIVESAADASKPIIGNPRGPKFGYDPAGLPISGGDYRSEGEIVTKENTKNAIPLGQAVRGKVNSAVNVASLYVNPATLATRTAVNAGLGAINDPEKPLRGATAGAVLGEALHGSTKVAGKVAPKAAQLGATAGKKALEAARPVIERARAKVKGTKPPAAEARPPVEIETPTLPQDGQVNIRRVSVSDIDVDPVRFQYKAGTDATTGAGSELKGLTQFDEQLAGVISVWTDPATGKTYAVNGHHRLELAKRTGHSSVNVQDLPAKTPEEARAMGALANVAEGRGTATDAAQFFRSTGLGPDDLRERVSFNGVIARNGMGLSKLAPDLFDRVVRGEVPESAGAVIGSIIDQPELQRTALGVIQQSGKRLSESEIREVARQVLDAGSERTTQETLFGNEAVEVPLYVEKAQLATAVTKRLNADRRLFGYVAKEGRAGELSRAGNQIDVEGSRRIADESAQLEEVFRQLYTRKGAIADALTRAARRIANGEKPKSLVDELYPAIREAVHEALPGQQGAGDPTSGIRDTGGQPETGYDAAGRQAAEFADELDGRVPDSTDPAQSGFVLTPDKKAGGVADLLTNPPNQNQPSSPDDQGTLFGGKAGTAESRRLEHIERGARSQIGKLRQILALETNPQARAKAAQQLAELEKLVNRDKAISADELATRSIADKERGLPQAGPDQGVLFSPASEVSRLGSRIRTALGIKQSNLGDVVALRKISRTLAEATGVPIREGRGNLKRMSAAGAFWVKPEMIRVKRLKALDTAAHEVGHYLDKKYHLRSIAKGLPKEERVVVGKELVAMGRELYGSRTPNGGYASEGVAQWFRFFVTERPRAVADAPAFSRYMNDILSREPALLDALNKAHDDFTRFQAAPANEKIASMIERSGPSRLAGIDPSRLIDHWFNDLQPIKRAQEALGKPTDITKNAAVLAELTKGNAGRTRDMLQNGVIEFGSSKRVTRGMQDILREVGEKNRDAFTEYLVAEQVLTKSGQGIDTGFDIPAAQEVSNAGRSNPVFANAAKDVWDFRSALLDYMADAGLMTKGEVKGIRDGNPTPTPFYRYFDPAEGGNVNQRGGSSALARNSAGVHRMRGSDRAILDPLQSIVSDAYNMVDRAHKHEAATVLIKVALDTEGGARFADLLPEVPKEMRRINLDRVREQLLDAGWNPPDDPALLAAMDDVMLTAFYEKSRSGAREMRDQVLPILIEGERKWVQVNDPRLWEAIEGMSIPELGLYERILTAPTRMLRTGATQVNPDFALVNPLRDSWPAAIYSVGPTHLPGYAIIKGLGHLIKERIQGGDSLAERWAQMGGENAGVVGADKRTIAKQYQQTVKELMGSRETRIKNMILHPIQLMRSQFEILENATRLGEFGEVRSVRMSEGMPEQQASMEASYSARNVTQDFFKSGSRARVANRYIPFFAAQLGEINKLATEFSPMNLRTPEGRARYATVTARAAAYITVPSVMLYLLQKDDPDYQEIPEYIRANSWVIVDHEHGPVPLSLEGGRKTRIWIVPRPHLLGYTFGYMPEKFLEYAQTQDPKALNDLVKQSWSALTPPVIPTILGPLLENYANRSLFNDRAVVPKNVEDLDAEEQSTAYTGEAARLVGKAVDYSPAKIENVVRGYTGGAGMAVKDAVDAGIRNTRERLDMEALAAKRTNSGDPLDRTPVIGRFIGSRPGADAKSVQKVHDDFHKADEARKTWRRMLKQGRTREAAKYILEHRSEILSVAGEEETGTQGELRQVRAVFDEIAKARKELAASNLPVEEKAVKDRQLQDALLRTARDYLAKYRSR